MSDRRRKLEAATAELAQSLDKLADSAELLLDELADGGARYCECTSGELASMCCEPAASYWSWRSKRERSSSSEDGQGK